MAVFSTIATWVTSTLESWGVGASLAAGITQFGMGLALNAVAGLFQKTPTMPRQEVQAVVNQSDAPRKVAYGLNRLGGVRAFFEARNGKLTSIIVYHQGPVSDLLSWVVDGEKATIGSDGDLRISSVKLERKIFVSWRNGTPANYSGAQTDFPSLWTDDHKLEGLVTAQVRMHAPKPEDFSKIFPRGVQTAI